MSLTPEQASVIENPNESKLVVALPGSGKTHTTVSLAERILSMQGTKVLMVTFTNAAAVRSITDPTPTQFNQRVKRAGLKHLCFHPSLLKVLQECCDGCIPTVFSQLSASNYK